MYKKMIVLMILFLIPSSFGYEDITLRQSATLELNINSSTDISFTSPSGSLDYAKISLNYLIENSDNQRIFMIKTTPTAKISDKIVFEWSNPKEKSLSYNVKASLETNSKRKEITRKVSFPIKELPKETYEYTKATGMIDTNDDIKKLASSLSENEDDLYSVVFNLAEWTNKNIKYDLSSAGADAVETSSWVLKNRVGVCDEITNLFISMCRSLGIPARFVTGMSYTNDPQFEKPWGLHGWAEVYFPGYGWMPFDPTYGEIGFIDAGHIKLKDGVDSNKSSTEYEWRGKFADLNNNPLKMDVVILDKGNLIIPSIDLSVQVFDEKVGFGSYNYIEAVLNNKNNYYTTTSLSLVTPLEITIIDEKTIPIFLKPYEKRSVFWRIKVPEKLEENYRYTYPFSVTLTQENHSIESEFEVSKEQNTIDYKTITDIVDKKSDEKEKDDSITLFCTTTKNEVTTDEIFNVKCAVTNNMLMPITDLNVCLLDECKKISVLAGKEAEVSFEKSFNESGYKFIEISARNENILKTFFANVMVLDTPKVEITDLKYPKSARFDDTFSISFTMTKKSYAIARDAKVTIYHNKNKESWSVNDIEGIQPFSFQLSGEYLKLGDNNFKAIVEYADEKGESYAVENAFIITLVDTTFTEKVRVILNQFSLWIERMMKR